MARASADASVPLDIEEQSETTPKTFPLWAKVSCGLVLCMSICVVAFIAVFPLIMHSVLARVMVATVRDKNEAWEQFLRWKEEDALHIFLVGTGSPQPDIERAGPCTVVMGGGRFFVFDTGAGSMNKMGALSYPTSDFTAIFFTHFHSDHMGDLGHVLENSWIFGRNKTLDVYGPPGLTNIVESFNSAYSLDRQYRSEHHTDKYMPSAAQPANPIEFADPPPEGLVIYDVDGMTVTAFGMDHYPVVPAVGYKVEYKGRTVSITGDGQPTEAMRNQVRDTDMMIRNVLNVAWMKQLRDASYAAGDARNARLAHMMNDTLDYHSYPSDCIQDAKEQNVKAVVISHIIPTLPVSLAWLQRWMLGLEYPLPSGWNSQLIWAEEGMHFVLPANADHIEQV